MISSYYSDITFINAGTVERCTATVDRVYPTWSLEFMQEGSLRLGIDGAEKRELSGAIAFWHQPGRRYQLSPGPTGSWQHHYITMQGGRIKRLVETVLTPLAPHGFLPVANPIAVHDLMHRLVTLTLEGEPHHQPERVVLVENLVLDLVRSRRTQDCEGAEDHRRAIEGAAATMRSTPFAPHPIKELAAAACLSTGHFRRLFRRLVGRSPHRYLLWARMQAAARLLAASPDGVGAVAARAGYTDLPQFCKLFKQQIGLTPTAYRQALRSPGHAGSIQMGDDQARPPSV